MIIQHLEAIDKNNIVCYITCMLQISLFEARALQLDGFVDAVDRLSRRLLRNVECCDRVLVASQGLTAAQAYSLLALHERGEATMNDMATEMRLHSTTMTRMVNALVEKGLAERRPAPHDRRIVLVGLSPRGGEMVLEMQKCKREFFSSAFASLSESERDAILKGLRRLASKVEDLGAQCCAG